jgi:hypothetical protein
VSIVARRNARVEASPLSSSGRTGLLKRKNAKLQEGAKSKPDEALRGAFPSLAPESAFRDLILDRVPTALTRRAVRHSPVKQPNAKFFSDLR